MSGTGQLPELESLRTQLADVARELAERDRTLREQTTQRDRELQDLREQAVLLRAIIEGTAAETSDDFLASLVNHLTATLQVRYAIIGEVTHERPQTIRTIAVSAGGITGANFEYPLAQTPCETALTRPFACFDHHVQQTFPRFTQLREMGVDSYCGVPIRTKDGTIIGLLAVMDTKRLQHTDWLHSLLAVFATRAGAELQRQRAEQAQREAERRLRFTQFAMDRAVDGVLWADDAGRFIYANDAVCRSLGYSQEELLDLRINDIAPYHDPERFQSRLDTIKQGGAATYESVHRRKDGTEFPIEVSITYLEHEGNGYTCGIIRDITERTRIERERHQALADLQNIMETVPDIMFTLDTNGNLIRWNSRLALVTEYEPESLLNKSALAFVPVEEQTQTAAAIQRAFTEGYAELDGHLLTKTGRTIPYHWTGATLKDAAGTIIGITGIGRDVSEQKQAQLELTQQRRHLLESQAIAHLGSCEWDLLSNEMAWSDEQFRIFGHAPQAISVSHDTFLTALLPDDHDRVLAAMNNALLGNAPYDVECRIVRPTGEIRTIHCRGTIARDQSGHPIQMSGTVLDITERKRIDEALADSEQRYRTIFETMPDPLFVVSFDGVIRDANPAACLTYGYTRDEFTGLPVEKMIDPQSFPHLTETIEAVEQGRSFHTECLDIRKDGTRFPVDVKTSAFVSHGEPVMLSAVRDITDRKRMEEALRRSRTQLSDILENNPAVVYTRQVGNGWPHTFITPNIYQMLGYTSIDIIGRPELWDSLMHPEDLAELMTRSLPTLLHTGAHAFAARLRHRDGSYRWIENQARLTHLDDGPLLMVGTMTDITVRMGAEQALRESEARNRSILESVLDAVVSIDEHGGIIGWNAQAEAMFGYSAQDVLGLPLDETIIPARYRQAHTHGLNRMLQKGDRSAVRRRFEFSALHRNGHEFPVEFAIASTQIGGRPTFSAFIRDITERKRAETALRESEERYRTLIDLSPSGVFVFCDGRTVYVNSMAIAILGATSSNDILERSPFDFIHPDYHEDVTNNLRLVLAGEATVHRAERVYLKMDGTPIHVQVEAVRITWNGKPAIQGFFSDITERKRAEETLRASEARFRTTFEKAAVGMYLCALDGRMQQVNPAFCQILGYTEQELLALDFQSITHPDDLRQNLPLIEQLVKGELSTLFIQKRHLHKNSGFIWVYASVSVLYDQSGQPAQLLVMVQDITDRKRAEEALRRSEQQLRTVLDTLPIGVWFTDEKGHVLYGNPVGHHIWAEAARIGLPKTGGDGLWWETIAQPEGPHRWAAGMVLTRGHDVRNETLAIETHAGERRTIRNSAVPVKGDAGEMLGAIVLNEDITDRVRAENALHQEHALLMAVMDAATDIIFVKDLEGRYIHINRAGAHALGMPVEDVLGWNDYALWPTDLASSCQLADRRVFETGEPVTVEEMSVGDDGKTTIYLTTKAPYRNADGQIIGVIGVARDITERKQAEEALRASEERFAKAFRSSPYPIVISELESGRFIDANDAAYEVFGYQREEVANRTSTELGLWPTPDHRRHFVEYLQQAGAIRNLEMDLRMQNGELRHCLLSAELIELHGKRCMVTVGSDITEQKRAEENLQRSHAFIRQIIDTDPNFIFAKDRDGRFTLVNKAVAEAYGTTVDDLIGKTDADFNKNAEEVAFFLRKDRDVIERLQDQFIPEERITDAAGTVRWLQTVKRPILDKSGRATMVLGAATDITERKQMEEALRQRERDLRAAIDERERISQDLHDGILQSLYAVGLGLEACKPLMTQRHYKKAVATMSEAIGQLNHVMSEVRNFIAGLESQVLQGSTFPAALQEMVTTLAASHPLRCTVSVDETAAGRISTQQALHLLNIVREALSNSLRHAQATKATVTLKPLSRCLRLSIVDNGIGFEPTGMRGVGHGLTNMAARARKVGGRFAIKSVPQHGTRITIDLPKEDSHAESESEHGSTAARR